MRQPGDGRCFRLPTGASARGHTPCTCPDEVYEPGPSRPRPASCQKDRAPDVPCQTCSCRHRARDTVSSTERDHESPHARRIRARRCRCTCLCPPPGAPSRRGPPWSWGRKADAIVARLTIYCVNLSHLTTICAIVEPVPGYRQASTSQRLAAGRQWTADCLRFGDSTNLDSSHSRTGEEITGYRAARLFSQDVSDTVRTPIALGVPEPESRC